MHSISGFERESTREVIYRCAPAALSIVGLLILLLAGGCCLKGGSRTAGGPLDVPAKVSLEPVVSAELPAIRIPFAGEGERGALPDGFAQGYPLSFRDCELLAARNSSLSRILEQETKDSGPCGACGKVDPCVRDSINEIVMANSLYQRNVAAEKALLAYWGLVEVYLQNQLANETVGEIEGLQKVLDQLSKEGLLREVDPQLLVRQRIDAISDQHELLYNFETLNETLRALLGLEATSHPIWTVCQIESWQPPEDLTAEIQLALDNRSDLIAIEKIAMQGDDQVLQVMRSSVRSVSPVAGFVLERRIFGGFFADHSAEIQKRRSQLSVLHAAQTDLARATVADHFYSIHKHFQQIHLDRERLDSLRKSELRLSAKRQVGPIKVEEVLSVKSDILKARSTLIHHAVALQMALVKLKATQGLLGQSSGEVDFELNNPDSNPGELIEEKETMNFRQETGATRFNRAQRIATRPRQALPPLR